jgi:hypothetical protein
MVVVAPGAALGRTGPYSLVLPSALRTVSQ